MKLGTAVLIRGLDVMGVITGKPSRGRYEVTVTSNYAYTGRVVVRTRNGLEVA